MTVTINLCDHRDRRGSCVTLVIALVDVLPLLLGLWPHIFILYKPDNLVDRVLNTHNIRQGLVQTRFTWPTPRSGSQVDFVFNAIMSDSLYASCAEVLSLAQSNKEDLATLLDPENGFAPKLRQICQEQLLEAEDNADGRYSMEELEALSMESDTWGLLQAVMP